MRSSRFILCKIRFYGFFMKINEENYLNLSLTKVAKRFNHLDLSLAKITKSCNHHELSPANVAISCNYLDFSLAKLAKVSYFFLQSRFSTKLRFGFNKGFGNSIITNFHMQIILMQICSYGFHLVLPFLAFISK